MRRPRTCRHWPTASCGSSCGRVGRCSTAGMAHRPGSRRNSPKAASVRLRVVGRQVGSTPFRRRAEMRGVFLVVRLRRFFEAKGNCNCNGNSRSTSTAASACVCWLGRVRVGWRDTPQVRPCRLVSAIHGAQRSRQPTRTHPLTVQRWPSKSRFARPGIVWLDAGCSSRWGFSMATGQLFGVGCGGMSAVAPHGPDACVFFCSFYPLTAPTSPTHAGSVPRLLPGAVLPACRPVARARWRGSGRNPAPA